MESNPLNPMAQLDESKFKRLAIRIYQKERENFKTKKLRPNEMVELIRKMIEMEVSKDDN